jgi:hypothetical protein
LARARSKCTQTAPSPSLSSIPPFFLPNQCLSSTFIVTYTTVTFASLRVARLAVLVYPSRLVSHIAHAAQRSALQFGRACIYTRQHILPSDSCPQAPTIVSPATPTAHANTAPSLPPALASSVSFRRVLLYSAGDFAACIIFLVRHRSSRTLHTPPPHIYHSPQPSSDQQDPAKEGQLACLLDVNHGAAAMLRQGGREEGPVDAGGGPPPRLLHPGARPRQLARHPHQDRYVCAVVCVNFKPCIAFRSERIWF